MAGLMLMNTTLPSWPARRALVLAVTAILAFASRVHPNGGPFLIKYPSGDPAAKGVLARLDARLEPVRETRLVVREEFLSLSFSTPRFPAPTSDTLPLVEITADYRIQNPTEETIAADFGFPILRGIYIPLLSMTPAPDVRLTVDGVRQQAVVIHTSSIYGLIRQRVRAALERAIAQDPLLAEGVRRIRSAADPGLEPARLFLQRYLVDQLGWTAADAVLMVEYASLDLGPMIELEPGGPVNPWFGDPLLARLAGANLGPLGAIGEQKATQFLAGLAARFDPAGATYEKLFAAWGGDVREMALDLGSRRVRPRELTRASEAAPGSNLVSAGSDPTLYARVDYLDESRPMTDAQRASCRAILKHLPVIFTFTPMNLLYYQVAFPPGSERAVKITYPQYAFVDSGSPASYQIAYVVHPASFWDRFGPIHLQIAVPPGVVPVASAPLQAPSPAARTEPQPPPPALFTAEIEEKTGILFVALPAADWKKSFRGLETPRAAAASLTAPPALVP